MKVIDRIALVLVIIGAINWGLIGFFGFNLVDSIFGAMSIVSRIIAFVRTEIRLLFFAGIYNYFVLRQLQLVRRYCIPLPG